MSRAITTFIATIKAFALFPEKDGEVRKTIIANRDYHICITVTKRSPVAQGTRPTGVVHE